MFGFGKKEKDEEILENELPAKRKFRDLKSENKKTRKEPVKPWGRTERILILAVLGLTVGVSAILGAIARGNINLPHISISGGVPAVSNISFDQTFVFEKKKEPGCCEKPILDFKNLTDELTGNYGFFVYRLSDQVGYGFNQDDVFKAASLIKIPTVVALYQEAQSGRLNLDGTYILRESDKFEGNGSLINYPAGSKFTFRQLARFALNESDNTAFNIFEIYLGDRKIQEAIAGLGMANTSIYDNTTTPRDIVMLFAKLKNAEILSPAESREILSYLENTSFDAWLRAGVPEGINIEHKYGRLAGVVNDVGVVESNNPYIIAVLSTDVDENEADRIIPEVSKAIYNFETK